jgi:hypothetical protein
VSLVLLGATHVEGEPLNHQRQVVKVPTQLSDFSPSFSELATEILELLPKFSDVSLVLLRVPVE